MRKRFLSVLLALCLVMVMIPLTALADDMTATATNGTTITNETTQEALDLWAGEGAVKTETVNGVTTITLLKNFNLSSASTPITFGDGGEDKMILDLNGHSISSVTMVIVSRCDLTIKDSAGGGKVFMDTSSKSAAAFEAIVNQKKLTIESGSFEAKVHESNAFVGVIGSAVADVETIVNGGNFLGNSSAINVTSGTTTINGGTFEAGTYGVVARNTAEVYFPANTKATVKAESFPIVVGKGSSSAGKVKIEGGSFYGTGDTPLVGKTGDVEKKELVAISGGIFTKDPADYVADNSIMLIGYTDSENTTVYAAGSSSAEKVLADAKPGETVTVLKGTSVSVPDQVTVVNQTGNEITVNGDTLAAGGSAVAHTFSEEWSSDGTYHWHKCTDCDEISGKAEHTMGEWVVEKEATEAKKGSRYRICSSCNYKVVEEIPIAIHVHSAVKVDAKAATATEAGNIAYWYCAGCGKYFSDEALTKEIAKTDTVIAATGSKDTDTSIPKTGDESNFALLFSLLSVSIAGMAGALAYGRKKKENR